MVCRGTHAAVLHPLESRAIMIHGGYGDYGNNDPHWLGDLSLLHTGEQIHWSGMHSILVEESHVQEVTIP